MRTDLFDPQPFNLPTHAGPHPHGDDRRWHRPALLAGVLAVVAVRLAWGHSHCAEGLPFYSIDENDVVEPTAGFLMGDWNHQYYAYGPVFMYLLSSVYGAAAFLSGHGVHRFATDVFFDPYWHYYLARMLSLIVILATVAVAVLETQRIFSSLAAVICLVLLAFPVAENFTNYTARIDVLQAFFQLLALFSLIRMFANGAVRHYVGAGAWTGLAIASKPIPGALIVPIALGVALLRAWRERAPATGGPRLASDGWATIRSLVADRRLYLAAAVGFAAFSLGFPFAILDFNNFWLQEVVRIQTASAAPYARGFELINYVPQTGSPLFALGIAALIYQLWRGPAAARILAGFATFYLLAFVRVPAREYFFIPILAPVCICISLMLADLLRSFERADVRFGIVVGLAVAMLFTIPPPRGHARQREQLAVRDWITAHVPPGTPLCCAGWYTNGPRLVSDRAESEAQHDYFMYGRDKNPHYVAGFAEAHRRYVLAGRPVYDIADWGRRDLSTAEMQTQFLDFCQAHGSRYVILGGVPSFRSLPDPLTVGGGISVFEVERPKTQAIGPR